MNIPKEAIEKAITGGWTPEGMDGLNIQFRNKSINFYVSGFLDVKGTFIFTHQEIALDPTFWQALGKALRWHPDFCFAAAHRFYDLILQSKDTDDFWQELLLTAI